MVRLINKDFGTDMWVDDSRVSEYVAAGHSLAVTKPTAEAKAKDKGKKTKRGGT